MKKNNKSYSLLRNSLSVFLLLIFYIGHASNITDKRTYSTNFLYGTPPNIDGVLSDSAWNIGEWQSDFTQQIPNEGTKPSQKTIVKIVYDHSNIYVAIFCYDNPELVRKIFTKRDQFGGDAVGVAFDSYYNQRTAYEFNITAAGQKVDLMHTGDGNIDFNWNSNWEAVTAISDSGWSAEYRIPFSQLRYNNLKEQTWGFFVWRYIDRLKEEDQWVLLPVNGPPGVHNFGKIDGISNIRESRQTEFLPYVSGKYEYNGENDNPYIDNYNIVPNAGIDIKMGISSNFTLDATINPDFGQVEADPSELNLSAFETFYEEKRPFFLEGRDIFTLANRPDQLFYSRRIGSSPRYYPDTEDGEYYKPPENTAILGSAKITGRTANGLSVGILETVTNNAFGIIYRPDNSPQAGQDAHSTERVKVEPVTSYFAGRIKKESNNANTIIGTSFNSVIRQLNDVTLQDEFVESANTMGVDLIQYFKEKNYYVKLFGAYSNLNGSEQAITKKQESHIHRFQRPDATHIELDTTRKSLNGSSGFFEIGKSGGKFLFYTNVGYWSPELNLNDIGFLAETDFIEQKNRISYRESETKKVFRNYNLGLQYTNRWTFGNEHTHSGIATDFFGNLTNLWSVHANFERVFPSLDTRILRGGPALYRDGYSGGGIWAQTNSSKRLFFDASANYYFTISSNSYHKSVWGSINFDPIDKLKLSLNGGYERNNFSSEFFDADLSDQGIYMIGRLNQQILSITFRAEYYIRPEISFQYYGSPFFSAVDYNDIVRVDDAKAKDESKRFYKLDGTDQITLNETENRYYVQETTGLVYEFDNPDVSFGEFQSNFVFRWEYKLGSIFYLVWSHRQNKYDNINSPHLNNPINELFSKPSGDAIMLKFSYWFNV